MVRLRRAAIAACLGSCLVLQLRASRPAAQAVASQAEESQARITCGGCHAFPLPDILPRSAWRDEFVRMHFLREQRLPPISPPGTKIHVPLPPDMEAVLPYFLSRAPERLPRPEAWPNPAASPIAFARHTMAMPKMPDTPAVAHLRLVDIDGDKRLDLIGADMRQGVVFTGQPDKAGNLLSAVGSSPHPSHVASADVDKDGIGDLLVADLGTFFPEDHDKGSVIWLRGLTGGKFSPFWLDGWPRVTDVDAADFNGDGKNDLMVAAFGWRRTGRVAILENRTANTAQPDFRTHVIDPRTGSINVIPVDLNGDGRMDFVALLAQEHETVIAYLNQGNFKFEPKVIYTAPHPNWGSSGIRLVDLDADRNLDVLLVHGDTFDDGIVKPYHGIQWLQNKGSYPFVAHTLAQMPGVMTVAAADLDGDGDLDVVAGALLAGGADVDEKVLPALVWLEQTKPGVFVRHTIEMGFPRHATLDVGDVNGDGAVDIVVGNFSTGKPIPAWVDVWINRGRKKR
jgi:hypothetical protein